MNKKFTKLALLCLCAVALASCNVKNSTQYKKLQVERDSLAAVAAGQDTQVKDMMSIINQVEDNFEKIKEAEHYLNVQSNSKEILSTDDKTRINSYFEMVRNIFKKDKSRLAYLSQKLRNSKGEIIQLKNTIDLLSDQLQQKMDTIGSLQSSLASRDEEIRNLQTNVASLTSDLQQLDSTNSQKDATISAQELELNTAYFIYGTKKELKQAKIITKKFLSPTKILKEGIDAHDFVKIDIRSKMRIDIPSKKARILSQHPKDSYKLVKDQGGKISLRILDSKRFWNLTHFLIIEI